MQSRLLPNTHAEDTFFMIRLDPDFDPILGQQNSNVEPMDSSTALARSLGEMMCSAEFLLQEMALPSQFENKNVNEQIGLPLRISRSKQKFDFMEKALQKFKQSKEQENARLSPFDLDGLLDRRMTSFPKRIALESDISLYDDDDYTKPTAACQPNAVIELPSAALSLPFSCARKVAGGINAQKRRFVDSSARVCKIDALSNICGPSKVSCLFIPQIDVCERKAETLHVSSSPVEQQKSESMDDLISFVRSCATSTIPESVDLVDGVGLIPGENDSYPILSWIACDDDMDESDQIDPIEIDRNAIQLKRKTFCSNAVMVGDEERSRCVLFTGCSSRLNASRKYSYRGFLSNHIVNPRVFQQRYHSMIEMNKLCQREIISTSNNGAIGRGQSNFYFSRMVITDFADRFSSKKKNSNSRRAPFAPSLKTRRHGRKVNPLKMKEGVALVSKQPPVVVPEIENLSSYSHQTKNFICANDDDNVGRLGRENLNIRGELLHLVTKARELKEEENAYLEELAMINRDREGAPNHASFEDDTISAKIDIGDDCTADANGKRKVSDDDVAIGGDAREKKKRKKEKKKKEKKKKKKSKRKRRDALDFIDEAQMDSSSNKIGGDDCDPRSKCEGEVKATSVKKLRIDENVPHTTQKSWVAVPTKIALGITPIHRPKDLQTQTQVPPSSALLPHTTPKVLEKRDNCNTSTSASSGKSPDSVAAANLFAESDQKVPKMRSQAPSESRHIAMEQESDNISEIDNGYDRSSATEAHYNGEKKSQDEVSPLTILTSESFLEQFGESIVELANGRWYSSLSEGERLQITRLLENYHSAGTGLDLDIPTRMKLNVCDCPLLDISGADIELGDGKALIVQRISQLNEGDLNKNFIKRIVMLGASGRYRHIHVILCIDTDIRPQQILLMQNALMQQSGCPCENISFEYTSLRTLSASIALQFYNSSDVHKSSRISQYATEENIQERARFLICLVPTMTVHVALRCLCSDSCHDGGATSMQMLMSMARDTTRELFPHKVSSLMPKACAEQLWVVANVNLSFASR